MVLIYVKSGVWMSSWSDQWSFVVDRERCGRTVALETTTMLEQLKIMVCEDYGVDHNVVNADFSYDLVNQSGDPPIIISNDRQVSNFVGYAKKGSFTTLCITFSRTDVNQKERTNIDLNKEPCDSSNVDDYEVPEINRAKFVKPSKESSDNIKDHVAKDGVGDDGLMSENNGDSEKDGRSCRTEFVNKDQIFRSKSVLKATMEIYAMKNNFDYRVIKSTKKWWYIRCKDSMCNWTVRGECLDGSTYFMINKCVAKQSCAPSKKSKFGKTASARTIGTLIQHWFEDANEGPTGNDIVQFMRLEHGCEITYWHAWEAREFAIAAVRGIPDHSYAKIPNNLHMIKAANPGTHTHYKTGNDGRFMYLFLSFGQSVRGFYNAICRGIVVDGTFLKNKYKGVLLVATAVDGNSNLYPIAFGVVDSENDDSWEWFFRQLNVVIADSKGLAFVSDRNLSIAKAIGTIYPQSSHGICIHHLLTNVVKFFKMKGLTGLVEKASRAYRFIEFQERFTEIFDMCHSLGRYLQEADVRKWARSLFPGFRYDIRTNNPAESINSVLRSPREFPVIPLLDSIREMLTRWFYERRMLSTKQLDHLTIKVEKKIDRRIVKAKGFQVYKVDNFRLLVKGDKYDCHVNLENRTCTCEKFDLGKIPCRHAIPAIYSRGMLTRWFYERRMLSTKQLDPLTIKVEKKIDRRIVKAKGFQVYKVDNFRSLVKGDKYDCHVDLENRTCTCDKFDLGKIPCRHAIPAIYSRGMEVRKFTDGLYTTATWRAAYAESINPIAVPESEWNAPADVELAKVLPPETRKSAGRPVKRRYETVEDKIRSSQGSRKNKKHKCSRCDIEGHKRGTCDMPI